MRLPRINRSVAWHATQNLLLCIGGITITDYIITLKWPLMLAASGTLSLVWTLIYKFENGIRVHYECAGRILARPACQSADREGN